MNHKTRRFISIVLGVLVAGLTSAAPQAQARTSGFTAANKSVQVDDDRRQCPKAAFTDIQSAVDALGPNASGTITVCRGSYTGEVFIGGAANLTLAARKGVVITPPFPAGQVFNTFLFVVRGSTNVTVQGFTVDGQGRIGNDAGAISFVESSGTILKNTVKNWHSPDFVQGTPASIISRNFRGEQLRIVNNTVTGYEGSAIYAEGRSNLTITGNRTVAPADAADVTVGINLRPMQLLGAPSGQVTRNRITGGLTPGGSENSLGIKVIEAGGLKVSNNKLDHLVTAILVQNLCQFGEKSDDNTITGNVIREVNTGIFIQADGDGSAAPPCDAHMDNYRVTGNKITDATVAGDVGILLATSGDNQRGGFILNTLITGNTITRFGFGVEQIAQPDGTITGVFAPNRVLNPLQGK